MHITWERNAYYVGMKCISWEANHYIYLYVPSRAPYNMAIPALSIFGPKLKIALTGVRSRVRESLAKRLI